MRLSASIWAVKLFDIWCFEYPLPLDKVIVLVIVHALATLAALDIAEAFFIFLGVLGIEVLELPCYVFFVLAHVVVDH